ncbi:hypothetical protein F4775DRAFT_594982 [Biscogniauxia sp. FL1348]|nr:hypothetical protein F4775DRAFT_594982 [Biscogniauxia sp. FL1348]
MSGKWESGRLSADRVSVCTDAPDFGTMATWDWDDGKKRCCALPEKTSNNPEDGRHDGHDPAVDGNNDDDDDDDAMCGGDVDCGEEALPRAAWIPSHVSSARRRRPVGSA